MNPEIHPSSAYVWFDAEFTSLDLEQARLLQVAAIVTDRALRRIGTPADDLNLCIRLESDEPVSPWVAENLSELLARCRSEEAVSIEEADRRLRTLVDRLCATPHESMADRPVLAGNSIHNDWLLMRRFLPEFASRLHYRLLDVSSLKLQWVDWKERPAFDKEDAALLAQCFPEGGIEETNAHDALFDVKASIAELAYYRTNE